ncbi:MAG TPA: hypothetical protein VKU19_29355 [Bryobacteraceae bacterium]|nr:hypothetical protein [Bryobacteraceae bacterium]
MASDTIAFSEIHKGFIDPGKNPVRVYELYGGPCAASAFIYHSVLNLDKDGAPGTYGWNNPDGLNSKGDKTLQINLNPLEGGQNYYSQFGYLGNACGHPGDGTVGYDNFKKHDRNFYWAGVYAVTKAEAHSRGLVIDTRDYVEAGRKERGSPIVAKGHGYFPVIQSTDDAPAKGYYVSTTSILTTRTKDPGDPTKYVDATIVPYAVLANLWALRRSKAGKTLGLGDFGLAIDPKTGTTCGFLYGDTGTANKVGECSSKVFDTFCPDITVKPEKRPPVDVTFIAFPGTGFPTGAAEEYKKDPKKDPKKDRRNVVGPNPQNAIRAMVMPQMIKIAAASNARELAQRIALGLPENLPKPAPVKKPHQVEAVVYQNVRYFNIIRALAQWGGFL